VLCSWFGYFKLAQSRTFIDLDKLIRRRLRALLRKQEKRPGVGRSFDDQKRWPNAYFADLGCSRFTRPGKPRDSLDARRPRHRR
jgi:RNA-directed DNA polymerase